MKTKRWMINYTGYSGSSWKMSYGHVFLSVKYPVEALSQDEIEAAMERIRAEKGFDKIPIIHSVVPVRDEGEDRDVSKN